MPNWCFDEVIFYQKDGKDDKLKILADDLNKITELPGTPTSDSNWMGKILIYKCNFNPAEYNKQIDALYQNDYFSIIKHSFHSRGFLDYVSEIEYGDVPYLQISVSSAWSPIFDTYNMISKAYELEYVLLAEEPGCEIYINTDKLGQFFQDKYLLDTGFYSEDGESNDIVNNFVSKYGTRQFFVGDADLIGFMNNCLNVPGDHYTELKINLINMGIEPYIRLYKYEMYPSEPESMIKIPMVYFN